MRPDKKRDLQKRRHWRVRAKVRGTAARPRLSVKFTGKHIYAQVIDDEAGRTVASASTRSKSSAQAGKMAANVDSAKIIGSEAAKAAQEVGVKAVVFDRGGAAYHGKVKALADAAREGGLNF